MDHHSSPSFAWQDDVKAAVVNAWQMSPFRHILEAGPSCLTEQKRLQVCRSSRSYRILRGAMRVSTLELQRNNTKLRTKLRWQWCQSRCNDAVEAQLVDLSRGTWTLLTRLKSRQRNLIQGSIDTLHRRVFMKVDPCGTISS